MSGAPVFVFITDSGTQMTPLAGDLSGVLSNESYFRCATKFASVKYSKIRLVTKASNGKDKLQK